MNNAYKMLEVYDFGHKILAGTSYRTNGSSDAPFKSLNLGFNSGDDVSKVLDNYKMLMDELDLNDKFLFLTNQVHGNKIKVVRKDDIIGKVISEDIKDNITFIDEYDGMVTDLSEVILMTFYADCVPLVFFDPVKNVIGNCHAGWRGTVKKIPRAIIDCMVKDFASDPADIKVAIGPCASPCCYEVDKKVVDEFEDAFSNHKDLYVAKEDEKYMLNLKAANKSTLLECAIDESNITISENCTMCNNDRFFSYRIENGLTGRHSAIITIK